MNNKQAFAADIVARLRENGHCESTMNLEALVFNLMSQYGIDDLEVYPDPRCDDWIQTFTGGQFFPLNPNPDDVWIEDIAHGLAMSCRFNGQSKFHYSVAQHSWLVSYLCKKHPYQGLMHDSPEAFLTDLTRPVKKRMPAYSKAEALVWSVIAPRFGLPIELDPEVHLADQIALMTEKRDVMTPCRFRWTLESVYKPSEEFHIEPWTPEKAKDMFLNRYYELRSTIHV